MPRKRCESQRNVRSAMRPVTRRNRWRRGYRRSQRHAGPRRPAPARRPPTTPERRNTIRVGPVIDAGKGRERQGRPFGVVGRDQSAAQSRNAAYVFVGVDFVSSGPGVGALREVTGVGHVVTRGDHGLRCAAELSEHDVHPRRLGQACRRARYRTPKRWQPRFGRCPRHRERPVHTGSGPHRPGDGGRCGSQNSSSSSMNSVGS